VAENIIEAAKQIMGATDTELAVLAVRDPEMLREVANAFLVAARQIDPGVDEE